MLSLSTKLEGQVKISSDACYLAEKNDLISRGGWQKANERIRELEKENKTLRIETSDTIDLRFKIAKLDEENNIMRDGVFASETTIKILIDALEDIRDNYDCEGSTHNPTMCRCCIAEQALINSSCERPPPLVLKLNCHGDICECGGTVIQWLGEDPGLACNKCHKLFDSIEKVDS